MKYLISLLLRGQLPNIDEDEIFSLIIGNNCTGTESIEYYHTLNVTGNKPKGDQKRQIREMLIFLSQFSILKWYDRKLHLDISINDLANNNELKFIATPAVRERKAIPAEEFLAMTSTSGEISVPTFLPSREIPTEEIFTEGKRIRTTHIKIERSPILRRLFFQTYPDTICNMCNCDTKERYPWTDNLLEIHHVLPLSSTLAITTKGTSIEDVVALCPTCHRSIHYYYKGWLDTNCYDDFKCKKQAQDIYNEAKLSIQL